MNELPTGSLPRISSIPGPRGPKGEKGDAGTNGTNGTSPQTTTTASFVMPASGAQVTVAVGSTSWVAVGQPLFVEAAGSFTVTTVLSATSLRLTAQNATSNTASGTVIATGKKVVPGAQMVSDTAAIDTLGGRVLALENAGNGNKTYYSATAPANNAGQLKDGDIWFDSDDGYAMYRWDGTAWSSVQRQIAAGDFGSGIRPVRYFATATSLPVTGNNAGDLAFANDTKKLYRWTGTAWTASVSGGDIVGTVDGALVANLTAGSFAYGIAIGDKLAANDVIIRNSAQIADGQIVDAHITNLSAGKIAAGEMVAVHIGHDGYLFHPSHRGKYFRATEIGTSFADAKNFGSGSGYSFSHCTPVAFYGPGNVGWRVNSAPGLCPDADGALRVQVQGRLIGYTGNILTYYRVNGGSYQPLASRYSADGNDAIVDCVRTITGVTTSSKVEFFVAPADGTGAATAGVTCRYEIDVMCFNW
jgi:hypothetical protein